MSERSKDSKKPVETDAVSGRAPEDDEDLETLVRYMEETSSTGFIAIGSRRNTREWVTRKGPDKRLFLVRLDQIAYIHQELPE